MTNPKLWLVREIFDEDAPRDEIEEFSQYHLVQSDDVPWLYDRPWWSRKFVHGGAYEPSGWWIPDGGVPMTKFAAERMFPHLELAPGECCEVRLEEA